MTAPALLRVPGSTVRFRAAASRAMAPMLDGAAADGRVLGTSAVAAWLAVAGDVLVLSTEGAVRLPNAAALGVGAESRPFSMMRDGDLAAVGSGCVTAPGLAVDVVRWWDPRPRLAPATFRGVLGRVAQGRARVDACPDFGLGAALAARDRKSVVEAAMLLLGRGRGLTPEGDDLLSAALAAYRLVGDAVGESGAWFVDRVTDEIVVAAAERTTSFSASLVRHACAGNVADPVARLLAALTDRGDLEAAIGEVLGVGHSSGAALADGVLVGASAACGEVLW